MEISGDEILRKFGGGYLVVATLCTIDRALSVESSTGGGTSSSKGSGQGQRTGTNNIREQQETPWSVSVKNLGAAHEIKELLLLLNSLFRLGSTAPMVGGRGIPRDASRGTPGNLNPPLVSEVDSALAAAGPKARRRRVSIDYAVNVSRQTSSLSEGMSGHRRRNSYGSSHGSAIHVAAAKGSEIPPTSLASNLVSPLLRQIGTAAAPTYPSRNGKKAIPWSEPRRPSMGLSSASTSMSTSRGAGYSGTYADRGRSMRRLSTIDANETLNNGTSPKSAPWRSLSSSPRLVPPEVIASGAAVRPSSSIEGVSGRRGVSMHASATTQRVLRSEFEKCGGGNFAVLLATRWNRGGIDHEERCGSTMLAWLALGESLFSPVGQPPKESHLWWNVGRSTSGVYPEPGRNENQGGTWWRKAERRRAGGSCSNSGTRRMNMKGWPKRLARISATAGSSSAGWSEGAGDKQPAEQLVVLATEITRDYFLSQVRG